MLYVYMYVVYFVMYDSVLILLLSYGHMIGLMKYSYSYSILILVEWVPQMIPINQPTDLPITSNRVRRIGVPFREGGAGCQVTLQNAQPLTIVDAVIEDAHAPCPLKATVVDFKCTYFSHILTSSPYFSNGSPKSLS